MQFTLTGKNTWPLDFYIEEYNDGFAWSCVDEKVCLAQGKTSFLTEVEAQADAIKWFEDQDVEYKPETKEDRLYFYEAPNA